MLFSVRVLRFAHSDSTVHVDGVVPGEPVLGAELTERDAHELVEGIRRHREDPFGSEDRNITHHTNRSTYQSDPARGDICSRCDDIAALQNPVDVDIDIGCVCVRWIADQDFD